MSDDNVPDDNVVELNLITKLDIPVERVLKNVPRDLDFVIVIGEEEDGTVYFASSKASGPDVLWAMEKAKLALLNVSAADIES